MTRSRRRKLIRTLLRRVRGTWRAELHDFSKKTAGQKLACLRRLLSPDVSKWPTRPVVVEINPILRQGVRIIGLVPSRTQALKDADIFFLGDLVVRTRHHVQENVFGIGQASFKKIEEFLEENHLYLGMNVPGWPPRDLERPTRLM